MAGPALRAFAADPRGVLRAAWPPAHAAHPGPWLPARWPAPACT